MRDPKAATSLPHRRALKSLTNKKPEGRESAPAPVLPMAGAGLSFFGLILSFRHSSYTEPGRPRDLLRPCIHSRNSSSRMLALGSATTNIVRALLICSFTPQLLTAHCALGRHL